MTAYPTGTLSKEQSPEPQSPSNRWTETGPQQRLAASISICNARFPALRCDPDSRTGRVRFTCWGVHALKNTPLRRLGAFLFYLFCGMGNWASSKKHQFLEEYVFPQQLKAWVPAQIGSGVVRGGPEVRFHEGSTRVPPRFHESSTRVPPGLHQGFHEVLQGLRGGASTKKSTACC